MLKFKVGDRVLLQYTRLSLNDKLNDDKNVLYGNDIGKIFKIIEMGLGSTVWDYYIENNTSHIKKANQDQLESLPILETELWRALEGKNE